MVSVFRTSGSTTLKTHDSTREYNLLTDVLLPLDSLWAHIIYLCSLYVYFLVEIKTEMSFGNHWNVFLFTLYTASQLWISIDVKESRFKTQWSSPLCSAGNQCPSVCPAALLYSISMYVMVRIGLKAESLCVLCNLADPLTPTVSRWLMPVHHREGLGPWRGCRSPYGLLWFQDFWTAYTSWLVPDWFKLSPIKKHWSKNFNSLKSVSLSHISTSISNWSSVRFRPRSCGNQRLDNDSNPVEVGQMRVECVH